MTAILLPQATDFADPATLVAICELDVDYVYVGKASWSFMRQRLQAQPAWYSAQLELPGASIYEVAACTG